jgi:hypothetical protein
MKAKLSFSFYLVSLLLIGITVFAWYGALFMNTEVITDENGQPLDDATCTALTAIICAVAFTWTVSSLTVIRQMLHGYAFYLDEVGIHNTASGLILFAFIFVIPIKLIPYSAITDMYVKDNTLTVTIDKSKIKAIPPLKLFVRREYHFFNGFTKLEANELRAMIEGYMKGDVTPDEIQL